MRASWPGPVSTSAVLEAGDGVGGRVRTDLVDGFRIDRGFQVLNDAYPEVRAALRTSTDLRLQRLDDAVTVRAGGRLHGSANPLSLPTERPGLADHRARCRSARSSASGRTPPQPRSLPPRRLRGRPDVTDARRR